MPRSDGGMFQKFKQQPILDQIPSGDVVVAVSGGADSTALLHLISRISGERKWNVVAGHIQHNLRGTESKRDEDFVRSLAAELQIPFASRSIHPKAVPKNLSKLGLEGAARILRYRALASIARERSAGAVLTAHHADDQAETFLLQILRGSDLPSLAGIRLKNQIEGAPVIRPLLPFSRKEILQYLKSQGLDHCRDSSNRNMDFRRNWVRLKLLPLMRTVQPRIAEKIGDLAAQISASDAFPARLALRRKFKYNIRSRSHSERIQNRRNGMVRSVRLNVPGSTSIPSIKTDFAAVLIRAGEGGAVPGRSKRNEAYFDADKTGLAGWTVGSWRPGDRFKPFGLGGRSKKLQDFFTDAKVPHLKRSGIPLLKTGKTIRWVAGYRTDEESRVGPATRRILKVRFEKA